MLAPTPTLTFDSLDIETLDKEPEIVHFVFRRG